MEIRLKRVYNLPEKSDGKRILVDRLWPRGLTKEKARLDFWAKEISPSNELRQWYSHDPAKWDEFRQRYFTELDASPLAYAELLQAMGHGPVTFLFSSKEPTINNAAALTEYVEAKKKGD